MYLDDSSEDVLAAQVCGAGANLWCFGGQVGDPIDPPPSRVQRSWAQLTSHFDGKKGSADRASLQRH